ncbi:hypothetical protein LguiB_027659 [Lonicera macranthoides]
MDNNSDTIVSNTAVGGENDSIVDARALEQDNKLVIEIDNMLDKLEPLPSYECCIYRVPKELRKVNEDAYTPCVVSIGPFHHSSPNLESMEQVKKRYMNKLVRKNENSSLKNCIDFLKKNESKIRRCYSEPIPMDNDKFVTMILVDSCFIIMFLIYFFTEEYDLDVSLYIDVTMMNRLTLDLMLLENQVPFFVLQELCSLTTSKEFSILNLAPIFLKEAANLHLFKGFKNNFSNLDEYSQCIKHFTHLFLLLHQLPSENQRRMHKRRFQYLHSTTELSKAGVEFRKKKTNEGSFDITFSDPVLEIPTFLLTRHTEIQIRNIIAAEHLLHENISFVTEYFLLMDCLINTTKDVKLLVNKKIIINHLGDNNEAADFINKLCINVPCYSYGFHFSQVYEQLKIYYNGPRAKLKRKYIHTLKRDYCHTPWKTTATIVGVMLVVLTIIQTVFSIISALRDK